MKAGYIKMGYSVNFMMFIYVSDRSKNQEMCTKAVKKDMEMQEFVADHSKTRRPQEICKKAIKKLMFTIVHVPDQCKT